MGNWTSCNKDGNKVHALRCGFFAADCKVWTRITVDTDYNREGQCWLRETVNEHKKTNFTNSGVKEDMPELQSGQESDRGNSAPQNQQTNSINVVQSLFKSLVTFRPLSYVK